MKSISTKHEPRSLSPYLFDDWFDPIEACVRERVREVIGRFNVGRFEVEHPGDYATFNSNQLRDGAVV